jgi:His-Xaa-Ser repeat protein HxsA
MLGNKEMLKNVVMRMQLTLQFEGYYQGTIDGVMGPGTRAAVMAYKRDHGLSGTQIFDTPTLNALGIRGY